MKRLCRDTQNKLICGVCSGVAEYFNIDPTLIRIVWAVLILCAGFGILPYIICAIIMPDKFN